MNSESRQWRNLGMVYCYWGKIHANEKVKFFSPWHFFRTNIVQIGLRYERRNTWFVHQSFLWRTGPGVGHLPTTSSGYWERALTRSKPHNNIRVFSAWRGNLKLSSVSFSIISLSTLSLKPRTDATRSPKQGYQWPHKKDWCPIFVCKKLQKFTIYHILTLIFVMLQIYFFCSE